MDLIVRETSRRMSVEDKMKMIVLIKGLFGLSDSDIVDATLEYQLKSIITGEQRDALLSFIDSELNYLQQEEERSSFQRYNRLEKFNLVLRKFNREMRIAESREPKTPELLQKLSVEELFYTTLKGKLEASLKNMRALRDKAAASREYYKMVNPDDMKKLGLDDVDYSVLFHAMHRKIKEIKNSNIPDCKQEAQALIMLMESGELRRYLRDEFDARIIKLSARKSTISDIFDRDVSGVLAKIDVQISDMEKRKDTLFSKMDEVYEFVQTNFHFDWPSIKTFDNFMIVSSDGTKSKAFSEKEVKAMELMGGWDNIIKIMDQGRLKREVIRIFANGRKKSHIPTPKNMD